MFSFFLVKYKNCGITLKKKKKESLCPESIFIIEERARKDLRRSPSPFSYPKAGLMIHEAEFPRRGVVMMHEPLKSAA